MVKVTQLIVTSRPVLVFFSLAFLVVVFGSIPITIWRTTTKNITNDVALFTENLRSTLVSDIENIGKVIYPKTNSSTIGLARVVDDQLTTNNTQFTEIETQIAPVLFRAYLTISQVSQVSYLSTDGLLFSYISEPNKTVSAIFANSSIGGAYTWYTQTVDQKTGRFNGNAINSKPINVTNTDWFKAAEKNYTTGFLGTGLGEGNETLFQNVVRLYSKKGVVWLGFPVEALTDILNRLDLDGGEFYLWSKDRMVLVRESSLNGSSIFISDGSICFKSVRSGCIPNNCSSGGGYEVEIGKSKFQAYCSRLEVSGVSLWYTLMFPNKGSRTTSIENNSKVAMILLIVTMILALLWPLGFVIFMVEAAIREMYMRSTLITQMEATQQAERKSMNKSQAFAKASHDIRGSLAGINGLVDLCREEVRPGSELDSSLKQVNVCTQDLVALLNSVLDMSKIESGKMQLEDEDFNLAKLLEDVTDLFYPVAMKKGVDVVLDPQDGSIFRFSNVRGDGGKLKQILKNLVSNAVKFTVEGHISIRAWAQRPGSKNSDSKGNVSSYMFWKNKDQSSSPSSTYEMEISNSLRNNANDTMEFVFEVDDTGKGIPMEMRKLVFENYVQVRETAQGQEGTGLGLGIVQSLVRLMGGEIRITDKAMGEKGTCFRFNVLLTSLDSSSTSDTKLKQDIESGGGIDYISTPNLGLTINTSMVGGNSSRNLSPRFNNCLISSPKQEPSRVLLLLKDDERRRVIRKYLKSLGIKVTIVDKWEHLDRSLKRLFGFSNESFSSSSSKELPLSSQIPRRRSNSFSAFVLLVIDAKTGPFPEIFYDTVEQFRGLQYNISCKVVWLNEPKARGDISYMKPLHGSRLNRVLKMLPEFGGIIETTKEEAPVENEEGASLKNLVSDDDGKELLTRKRVLVVDDNRVTCLVAARKLKEMGVSEVKQCDSGKEALRLVSESLITQSEQLGLSNMLLPFDYIFMDCQMPEMDGYEATREIRKVERQYGMHIPIIAVSGHDPDSIEAKEAIKAGMDAFLEKNLNQDQLMNIIRELDARR